MKFRRVRMNQKKAYWALLVLVSILFTGCKDNETTELKPYDPNLPVEITDFIPKKGGGGSRLVLYGQNFGVDQSMLRITVDGKEAKIINVLGDAIYCLVPAKAYKGKIELSIGEGDQKQTIEAKEKFIYERQLVVSTLCGDVDDKGHFDVKEGPFDDCGGFQQPTWFEFDPKDRRYLYLAQDEGKPLRMLDLEKKYVYDVLPNGSNGMHRMRTITWTADGDTMIIANDAGGEKDVNNSYLVRNGFGKDAFKAPQTLQVGKQCNGSAVHPVNHELYYNSYGMGEVFKFDYWANKEYSSCEKLYNIQDTSWEFNIRIHPSGDYAYIVVINQHYIMRTDYNWKKKTFGTPYLVCGRVGAAGWDDKVGDQALLNTPYQGVFVKNKQYEKEGREDIYDFYFCDRGNHCVRYLTPEGSVTTFAGRGSLGTSGYSNGGLRSEARFNNPAAIAYDEQTEAFYIGDWHNHRIRKIALEEADVENLKENN